MCIESIDDYTIFHKMMRKKNASLNEAAFKILKEGPPEAQMEPVTTGVPTTTPGGKIEDTKFQEPTKPTPQSNADRKKELQDKQTKLGRLNTLESNELTSLEKEQMELAAAISKQEQDDWQRKSKSK